MNINNASSPNVRSRVSSISSDSDSNNKSDEYGS